VVFARVFSHERLPLLTLIISTKDEQVERDDNILLQIEITTRYSNIGRSMLNGYINIKEHFYKMGYVLQSTRDLQNTYYKTVQIRYTKGWGSFQKVHQNMERSHEHKIVLPYNDSYLLLLRYIIVLPGA